MLAQRINEYLRANGIKQTWLAEQLQIPITTLNGILNGKTALKADMFIAICKALNVQPETFTHQEEMA